ncbi:MAG: diguanylate cyclase [Clostridiales bacterium]|nr:diguanylate cyclase [Clostridiales bacterium]
MKRRLLTDLNLTICVILGCLLVFMFSFKLIGGNVESWQMDFSEGWYYEDGAQVDFDNLRRDTGGNRISRIVSSDIVRGTDLCFETSNMHFNVYVNDKLVYEYRPELPRICGKYYGEYIHTVDLDVDEDDSVLTIEYDPLLNSPWTTFRYMELHDGGSYVTSLIESNLGSFLTSFIVFIIGATIVVVGFMLNQKRDRIVEPVSLGTTAIILAAWTSSGSRILQLISGNPAVVRVMDYLDLIWLPIPVILFVSSVTGMLKSKLTAVNLSLVGVNTLLTFTFVLSGMGDYNDVLIFTHLIIAFGSASIIYMIVASIRKANKIGKSMQSMLWAFGILIFTGLIDAVRYYTFSSKDAAKCTRIGLIIFVVILATYELNNILDINAKSAEAEIKDKLAHVDGLTGLYNRLAFNETEEEIRNQNSGKYVVIQFDINFLKKVNDNYGHAEGDRYIISAANIISDSFADYGKCFRIGGDEFFAILEGEKSDEDFEKALGVFEAKVKEFNVTHDDLPVPLQIAHGMAVYVPGTGSLEEAEKKSDKLMYEHKKYLKENA